MKSIKRAFREKREKTHNAVSLWLQPKINRIGQRIRLAGRIRLANRWARKHPKKMFSLSFGTLFILFLTTFFHGPAEEKSIIPDDVGVQSALTGLSTIIDYRNYHENTVNALALQGGAIKREIDSLVSLPNKTSEDSIRIFQNYRKLNVIINNLKPTQHEKN